MNPVRVNCSTTIRSALLLVLFLTESFAAGRCQIIESFFTVRADSSAFIQKVVGTEAVVLESDFGGVDTGKGNLFRSGFVVTLIVIVSGVGWGESGRSSRSVFGRRRSLGTTVGLRDYGRSGIVSFGLFGWGRVLRRGSTLRFSSFAGV